MKAAIFHEVGKPMTIEPIEVAPPKAGEVLVHYRAGRRLPQRPPRHGGLVSGAHAHRHGP